MKLTHDQRPVYPAGSPLPAGASGWTQCKLGAAYAVWLRKEDQAQSKADLAQIIGKVHALRTKAAAVALLTELDKTAFVNERLRDLKLSLINAMYAKAWPLIEV